MLRAIHEFVAAVRRSGVRVSSAEALDAVRAAAAVGLDARADLRCALIAALAKTGPDRVRTERVFDGFFSGDGTSGADLYTRLERAGFTPDELAMLRALVEATAQTSPAGGVLRALSQGELALDALLSRASRPLALDRVGDPARAGFLAMRVLEAARVPRAETDLANMRVALRGALGAARGETLANLLQAELRELRQRARLHVVESMQHRDLLPFEERPLASLSPEEIVRMERAVRHLAERLLGRAAVRARRQRSGRIDARRTMRQALRTGGVPMSPRFRRRTPQRPKLVMLCDVSESMHATARFMLVFVHAVQRLFSDARSFVFVSDIAEATRVFRTEPPARAIELAYGGSIVSVADNSHYAHAFRGALAQYAAAFDRRTTLLVLGDGRTNHFDPGLPAFQSLTSRVRRVLWLTPEPESAWTTGDSALPLYAREADQVLPVNDLASLHKAARALVRF